MSMPAHLSNANVYQRLGIRTIVNASGPSTRLSGGIMRPEVAAAMAEASQWCVDVAELQIAPARFWPRPPAPRQGT